MRVLSARIDHHKNINNYRRRDLNASTLSLAESAFSGVVLVVMKPNRPASG